jgi:murein tripeptide amidase MpaA
MSKLSLQYDHFYTYAEITAFLEQAVAEYPTLCSLSSAGKSLEGREIWVLTVTNQATGAAEDKPAMYIDGNIHAGEVTASHVAMHTIANLLQSYGECPEVTHLLETRTFYILPRVNPDGGEVYLTTPYMLRSSVRPNPEAAKWPDNTLYPEDVDGDDEIMFMRRQDPSGQWKVSTQDDRLLVPREPGDIEGPFYNLYPEGRVHNYNGGPVLAAPDRWDLDINRNFPSAWSPTQKGGGNFPLSEPETRAMAEFIVSHPNIGALQAYHTKSGGILRPSCSGPDKNLPQGDLQSFKALGKIGEAITGYPCVSVFEGFIGSAIYGVYIDWVYEHRGIFGYTTELWDIKTRAGVPGKRDFLKREFNEEEELTILKWNDEQLDGQGFMRWTKFNHPELGEVEIGGWHPKTVIQNCNFKFLQDECQKNYLFSLKHAGALPELVVEHLEVRQVEGNVYEIVADIANRGFLPTNVTDKAMQIKLVKPVSAELHGEGFAVLGGKNERKIGQLDGYRFARESWYTFGKNSYPKLRERVTWTVQKTDEAAELTLQVSSQRGGKIQCRVEL